MSHARTKKHRRHERILAELQTTPALRVSLLAENFGVSTETIRRDLDELNADGLINRTYGGAATTLVSREPALDDRYRMLVEERSLIAARAATFVQPGDVLMIDAGSTTAHFARRLAAEFNELTVITNSFNVATALAAAPSIRVIMCPGDFNAREGCVFGPETTDFLSRFNALRCAIGASAVSEAGPSDVLTDSVWVKRRMIEQSQSAMLLMDSGKYGQPALELVCGFDALDDIVVDARPDESLSRAIRKGGAALHVAS